MPDVRFPHSAPNWAVLAIAAGCFAGAGLIDTATVNLQSVVAATLAIVGVYGVAQVARRQSRPSLARLSLGSWLAFIAVAGLHALGPATVATALPAADAGVGATITAMTWAMLLLACSSTTFLAFREYSAGHTPTSTDDPVVDRDYEY